MVDFDFSCAVRFQIELKLINSLKLICLETKCFSNRKGVEVDSHLENYCSG